MTARTELKPRIVWGGSHWFLRWEGTWRSFDKWQEAVDRLVDLDDRPRHPTRALEIENSKLRADLARLRGVWASS